MAQDKFKLAVYGTLKEGFGNHRLINHCDKIDDGIIESGYGLFINGLPYLVEDSEGPGCSCEIYLVDKSTLYKCDILEGHPSWYRRQWVNVTDRSGETHKCYAYIYQGSERGKYVRKF